MKRWGLRHRGFKVGFVGVVVCSVFFVIGFAAPAWRNTRGLWMECSSTHRMCATHHSLGLSLPAWYDAVRAFECLALIAIILCLMEELYMDFLSQPSPDRRVAEVLALTAGTLGLVGCIIYAAFTPVTNSSRSLRDHVYLSWGFGLATTSCCFFIAFASVIAYFRHRGLDVVNYNASNAIHYNASDCIVSPVGVTNLDIAPPSYTEVMNQPGGSRGSAGPLPSEYAYYKPGLPDVQPPPYFPPPSGAQFQAPPPYVPVQVPMSVPGFSGQVLEGGCSTVLRPAEVSATRGESSEVSSGISNADTLPVSCVSVPQSQTPPAVSSETSPAISVPSSASQSPSPVSVETNPVGSDLSSVPVYYVTVFGQMVPVYMEELRQVGRDIPSPTSGPVPAYFIMIHGQHVPVYSEEQARALSE